MFGVFRGVLSICLELFARALTLFGCVEDVSGSVARVRGALARRGKDDSTPVSMELVYRHITGISELQVV